MAQRQSRTRESYMREIDFVFYHEKKIREAVLKVRVSNSPAGVVCPSSSGNISDPTATQAVKNLMPLKFVVISSGEMIEYPKHWLEVIDKTYKYCSEQKDCRAEVARRRYRHEDYRKSCAELYISKTTYHRLLELVKMYAALKAVQFGLITV